MVEKEAVLPQTVSSWESISVLNQLNLKKKTVCIAGTKTSCSV